MIYVSSASAPPDPFLLTETVPGVRGDHDTNGRVMRSPAINPAQQTLVLITAGQSLRANASGTQYTPTNAASIDNFNVYNGALYDCAGPMLGCTPGSTGPGNVAPRVADLLISNGKFDRVIIVPTAMGGSFIAEWQAGGVYHDRVPVAMRRLASRGITPVTPGVTFALEWGHGESDGNYGTSQAEYQAGWQSFKSGVLAAGFEGRIFVARESYYTGSTFPAITAAQAAVVDGVTVFAGGNIDSINSGGRSDDLHLNNTGAATAATLIYNAMVASGGPFA